MLLTLIPLGVLGWYGWSVISAIDNAQDVAVVDLPPREGEGDTVTTGGVTGGPDNDPSSFEVAKGVVSARTGAGAPDPAEVWTEQKFITFLVLGIDERPGEADRNADVIMLARLDLETRQLNAVSIPRDLQVDIPGHGPGKINGAYNIGLDGDLDNRTGGVAMMRQTIEVNFDVQIDEYVLVNFDGFTSVVDALGGIEIEVPETIVDPEYPTEDYGTTTLRFEAGPQTMNGEQALAYARTRSQDSDDQRRERQILVILAMFDKGKDIGNMSRIVDSIEALSGSIQTSIDFQGQVSLARAALDMKDSDIHMSSIAPPLVESGTAANGAWIYIGDPVELTAFVHNALDGSLPNQP